MGLITLPKATTLDDWLRRMGGQPQIQKVWVGGNKVLLQCALHKCKNVTLDSDAKEIVAVDFRQGNVPPVQNNLAFIEPCSQSLVEGCDLKAFHLDRAEDAIGGQASLDLGAQEHADKINLGRHIYRAIAASQEALNDSESIH